MTRSVELRSGSYVDSVALMQVSTRVSGLSGVRSAIVAMATDLNVELATGMGFEVPGTATPREMLVAIDADHEDDVAAALAELDNALNATTAPTAFGSAPPPVTVGAAARTVERPAVALISTPGEYAFADAMDALDAGLTTMVFSDNVPVSQEVTLKEYAAAAGLLLMGPDCGTAVVGGVALGFANVVRPGPVGIVAASGTGAQHLMTLLDGAGVGVSHCLGVGGRDLSSTVAGRSTLQALDRLAADDATTHIVVISKPPAADVAARIGEHAESLGKPVVFGLLGEGRPTLTDTAQTVVEEVGGTWVSPEHWTGAVTRGRAGHLRGLFSGGTLCDEAMLVASARLGRIASNIPLHDSWALDHGLASVGHTMIDFGDDRLTEGRPHPMIDGSLRVERLLAEIADPTCGVLLLDVVLGLGTAPDPAGDLAEPIRAATDAGVPAVVSLVGARDDPQDLRRQAGALSDAGAHVHLSNAHAAGAAVDLVAEVGC
jgi:FdrA protein